MREAIFALRTLCERFIQIQQKIYLCFIDNEKVFDKVKHKKITELLNKYQLGHQNIQLMNLYSEWIFRECVTGKSGITVGERCFKYFNIC